MRIRSTKPEFWRSERVASVSWEDRLVLKGLESYVDDNGVGKDDLALIVADVFPRDLTREPSRTLARVSEALNSLQEVGLLWRYEADGTDLLFVAFWESIQRIDRPSKGRFPRPDGTWGYGESEIRECDASPRECDASPRPRNRGTGEQGNRGTDSRSSAAADGTTEIAFDSWWSRYPRKVGKGQAAKAYRAALKKTTPETLSAAIEHQAPSLMAKGAEYCPHPATWLNGERWLDETHGAPEPATRSEVYEADMRPFDGDPDDVEAWQAHRRSERERIWRERGEIA